jgi:hypothetical protein
MWPKDRHTELELPPDPPARRRWDSVDLETDGQPHGAAGNAGADTRVRSVQRAPLRYAGMPADRFWEFEDAAVAIGRVRSSPSDLVKMLAVGAGTVDLRASRRGCAATR